MDQGLFQVNFANHSKDVSDPSRGSTKILLASYINMNIQIKIVISYVFLHTKPDCMPLYFFLLEKQAPL